MPKKADKVKIKEFSKLSPSVIFEFSTDHLLKKDKIRFYYALKGRDGRSGIAKLYSIQTLGRAVLLVSQKHESDVTGFLNQWNCRFKKIHVYVKNE